MSQDYDESLEWTNDVDPEEIRREAQLLIDAERRLGESGVENQDDRDMGMLYLALGKMLAITNDGMLIVVSDKNIKDIKKAL